MCNLIDKERFNKIGLISGLQRLVVVPAALVVPPATQGIQGIQDIQGIQGIQG